MIEEITITKKEYLKLINQAEAFNKLKSAVFESILSDPISEVLEDFRTTELYSDEFLNDLEGGLRKSNYLKRKHQNENN
jgi:hypothetical protein